MSSPEPAARPRLIAHRGASADFPENTFAAFDAAVATGIDGLELDVQLTRDGVPVVFHDWTLQRMTGRTRRLVRFTRADLAAMDVGSWFDSKFAGERIPTLAEVIARYGDRADLLIELKSGATDAMTGRSQRLAESVLEALEPAPARSVFLLSFDSALLHHVLAVSPNARCILNLPLTGAQMTGNTVPGPERVCGFGIPIDRLTPQIGADIHAKGRVIMTYACNNPEQVASARTSGADFILTDRPAWLLQHWSQIHP